uniref:Uncharacterized protein n=1 Tax=Ixodes ricinus TaxID=34613 RepID=A0A147BF44_IXORI
MVSLASHFSAYASIGAPKWQRMMYQKPKCHAVGCRDPCGWLEKLRQQRVNASVAVVMASPTPGYPTLRGLPSWTATCSRTSVCRIHHSCCDTARTVTVTARRTYDVIRWKSRDHFFGLGTHTGRRRIPGTIAKRRVCTSEASGRLCFN